MAAGPINGPAAQQTTMERLCLFQSYDDQLSNARFYPDETGFGIYAITGTNYDLGDTTVVIDIAKETIIDDNGNVVPWQEFINAYAPNNVSAQRIIMSVWMGHLLTN